MWYFSLLSLCILTVMNEKDHIQTQNFFGKTTSFMSPHTNYDDEYDG